jgi:peptidoglycan/xylan/chitin deacetylase (PgdA/CDA1 family)
MLAMNPLLIAVPAAALGAAALTSFAAVNARSQLFGPTIRHAASPRQLAITFDDGPNPAITPQLLNLLARYDAKCTFFVVGKFARECPGLVKEISDRGHVLGNHTDTHPNLFFCGPEETHQELLHCTDAIQHASRSAPVWFRPPFGYRSPWLSEIVHRQGMRTVMWTLLPGDWRAKRLEWLNARLQPIAEHAQAGPAAKSASHSSGGDILCLHDGNFRQQNADRTRTLAALEYWLPRWRDLGLEFVTMDETFGKVVEA